jgi:hypothetical protein
VGKSVSLTTTSSKILKGRGQSYNRWTQVRLLQDPFLKTEKRKREPIPIPIVETGDTKPIPKSKRITGSVPLFKTETLESESETDSLPVRLKFIDNVLKRKVAYDSTFGVYQDDTDASFKIGRSSFK